MANPPRRCRRWSLAFVSPAAIAEEQPRPASVSPTELNRCADCDAVSDDAQDERCNADKKAGDESAEKTKEFKAKAAAAYKGVFYDNDFTYLNDSAYDSWHLGEALKQIKCGSSPVVDVGGEYRWRFHDEDNLRTKPLSGNGDSFLLHRTRLFANVRCGKVMRVYAEAIDATSNGERFPSRVIEVNRFDALNLFGEAAFSHGEETTRIRVGRQELLYGAQRLIAPLDWGNTRRTFDGAKLLYEGKDWNVDAFWTRPVPFGQHVPDDHNFDNPDNSREFLGVYATYGGVENQTLDLYHLRLAEWDPTVAGETGQAGDFAADTLGIRWKGECCDWLWEIEGGYQFGEFATDDTSAGFGTAGVGRKLSRLPWHPEVWLYFDWASGDADPTDGEHGTFDQYFPLAPSTSGSWTSWDGRTSKPGMCTQACNPASA